MIICDPGIAISALIINDKVAPTIAENKPKIKYKIPISLAFVEPIHLKKLIYLLDIRNNLKDKINSF